MSGRRKGREIALQILYQSEWGTLDDIGEAIRLFAGTLSPSATDEEDPALDDSDPALAFARDRVQGVLGRREELDALLARLSRRWRLGRMASVDRNILRLGAYELRHCPDIPPRVAINEAVELAKKFGTEESGAFINGILDAVLRAREGLDEEDRVESHGTTAL